MSDNSSTEQCCGTCHFFSSDRGNKHPSRQGDCRFVPLAADYEAAYSHVPACMTLEREPMLANQGRSCPKWEKRR